MTNESLQYKRLAGSRIRDILRYYPGIILTGARQTGKTTLLREVLSDYHYVSLDVPSLAEQAELNPAQFLADNPAPLIIDEAQYAPQLFRHLKHVIDQDRHLMGQYIITGSQKFTLMKEVGDSLAGRIAWLELETLSYKEITQKVELPANREELIKLCHRGQFPELWRQPDMPVDSFYSSYLATYLERDVREILNVTSLRDFERFIRILASRSGNILNKSEIARDVGVSVKAIGDWVSVLEASNQITLLEPYYQNISKRIIKSPKVYFNEVGLLCYLLRLTPQHLAASPFIGAVWETFVFAELRKKNRYLESPYNLFYYRDQRAKEVDFFLERGGEVTLMEVKWSETVTSRDAKNILKLQEEISTADLPIRNAQHYVISPVSNPYPITETVHAINITDWDGA